MQPGMILVFGFRDFSHFLTWQHADTIEAHPATLQ